MTLIVCYFCWAYFWYVEPPHQFAHRGSPTRVVTEDRLKPVSVISHNQCVFLHISILSRAATRSTFWEPVTALGACWTNIPHTVSDKRWRFGTLLWIIQLSVKQILYLQKIPYYHVVTYCLVCDVLWRQLELLAHFCIWDHKLTPMWFTLWHRFWTTCLVGREPLHSFSSMAQQQLNQQVIIRGTRIRLDSVTYIRGFITSCTSFELVRFLLWHMFFLKEKIYNRNNPGTENDLKKALRL
jgi:hypothetical protein